MPKSRFLILALCLGVITSAKSQVNELPNGDVGIGTTNLTEKFEVNGNTILNGKLYGRHGLTYPTTGKSYYALKTNNADASQGGLTIQYLTGGVLKDGMVLNYLGKVGIGTTSPDMKLTVKGNIHAEEVKIDLSVPAPDYVFKEDYNLRSIEEVEEFIKENSHLPEIPSAKEFEQHGVMLAEMDMNLLKKIEELTLYTIQQEKKIEKLEKKIEEVKLFNKNLLELQSRLEKLESEK